MSFFLSPVLNEQQFDANGNPLAGGFIETYLAGTTTPTPTFKTSTGTAHDNPIVLDSAGYYPSGTQLWLDDSRQYKFVVKDALGATLRVIDNISGVNDVSLAPSEWVTYTGGTFSFVSATSFSLAGDQRGIFQVNRRIRTTNTGGTIFSRVVSATYSAPNTTVVVANDSGVLDSGLSVIAFGFLAATNPSIPESSIGAVLRTAADKTTARNAIDAGNTAPLPRGFLSISAGALLFAGFAGQTYNFRNPSGDTDSASIAADTFPAVASTSSLGIPTGTSVEVFVVAINFGGVVEVAIINPQTFVLNERGTINTVALGAASNSADVFYSLFARTGVAYRVITRATVTWTSGSGYSALTNIGPVGGLSTPPARSVLRLQTANGYGSTNTRIRRFSTVLENSGEGIDWNYVDSATLGMSVTILTSDFYSMTYVDQFNSDSVMGISLNSTQLSTDFSSITAADRLFGASAPGANFAGSAGGGMFLPRGSVIRPHTIALATGAATWAQAFTLVRGRGA